MIRLRSALTALGALAAVVAAPGIAAAEPVPLVPLRMAASDAIADGYVVRIRPDADPAVLAARFGLRPTHVYTGGTVRGFAARMTIRQVTAVRAATTEVTEVSQDAVVRTTATVQSTTGSGLWHLDRVDQRNLPRSNTFTYTATGTGIRAYVLDTGIYAGHPEFEGRALNMVSTTGGSAEDCQGHGTLVAGLIGGSIHGVAKKADVRGVKVTDGCTPNASLSSLIAGMDWVLNRGIKPAVVNISMGAAHDTTLNAKATELVSAGYFVSVAAGNEGVKTCTRSPASATGVTAVGGTADDDSRMLDGTTISNYGHCTTLFAPGERVSSTFFTVASDGTKRATTATASGTSLAAPLVAGTAALAMQVDPSHSGPAARTWLLANTTVGKVTGIPTPGAGEPPTPNLLLFKASL
ncbi:S8 family peptidase [Lentzea sp.]|uniref:S8 family peptidase n=1 Tax=Lentzea sp. TaxID=56099 RepID=UPI002ED48B58